MYWIEKTIAIVTDLQSIGLNWISEGMIENLSDFLRKANNYFLPLIPALLALWGVLHTNKNSIKANVITTSRIDWIQKTRSTAAAFLTSCLDVLEFKDILIIGKSVPNQDKSISASIELENKFSEKSNIYDNPKAILDSKINEIQKNGHLLILYFGPDKNGDNDFIVYLIKNIMVKSNQREPIQEEQTKIQNELISDLNEVLRTYFKIEWKRATERIKEKQIAEALNRDIVYKRIKLKYKIPFECFNENPESNLRFVKENEIYVLEE